MSTIELKDSVRGFLASFARLENAPHRFGGEWLGRIRRRAIDVFERLGLPTTRDEAWKYTNILGLKRLELGDAAILGDERMPEPAQVDSCSLDIAGCARLVFVDGLFQTRLSSPVANVDGVDVASLLAATQPRELEPHLTRLAGFESRAFTALNTALFGDGAVIRVRRSRTAQPVHLLFLSTAEGAPLAVHPRILILLEEASQAAVIEDYVSLGTGVHFTNSVTEICVGPAARLDYYRLVRENERAFHVSSVAVEQERSSVFTSHALTFGGGLVRSEISVRLTGEAVESRLNGLTVAAGTQHIDNQTRIEHAKAGSHSIERYKAILDDKAHGVFNGKIFVAPEAQKTDAKQTNQAILLSALAAMDSKPELEIYADDVKCTHGATIGQLDDEALFYLRSRGLNTARARDLLVYAFASDIVNQVTLPGVRRCVERLLNEKLPRRMHPEGA